MRLIAFSLLFAISSVAFAIEPVPPLKGRVNDHAGVLSADTVASIEGTLDGLEKEKGSQVAVLIVPTVGEEAIEQYSLRVAESWKIGRKGVDDGVLFLVAVHDRAMRLEIGYGLEGAIPDAISKRIISDIVTPYFRDADYNGGMKAGVDAIAKRIRGEELPAPTRFSDDISDTCFNLFVGSFIAAMILRAFTTPLKAGVVTGIGTFIVGLFILPLLVAAIMSFVAFLIAFGSSPGGRSVGRGGSSRGGGFSGGGGSFGGGGASGRW